MSDHGRTNGRPDGRQWNIAMRGSCVASSPTCSDTVNIDRERRTASKQLYSEMKYIHSPRLQKVPIPKPTIKVLLLNHSLLWPPPRFQIFLANILLKSSISRNSMTSSTRLICLLSSHWRHSLKLMTCLTSCEGHSLDVRMLRHAKEREPMWPQEWTSCVV